MTSRFDSFEKDLRDALASEDLPSDGFTDRVMASVAETPQQKKTPPAYRRWLVSAAACLAVAAVLFPLLRNGRPDRGSGSAAVLYAADAADTAADNDSPMDEVPVGQGAPTSDGADAKQGSDSQQKLQTPDRRIGQPSAPERRPSPCRSSPMAMCSRRRTPSAFLPSPARTWP